MKRKSTAERLKQIMNERGLKQVDILNLAAPICARYKVKMNKSDLSQYVSGKTEPSQEKLVVLGMALNVSESWLMGFDVPMSRESSMNNTTYINTNPRLALAISLFESLEDKAQDMAIDNMKLLQKVYPRIEEPLLNAAHERTDIEVTDEMRKHDEGIMDDDDF